MPPSAKRVKATTYRGNSPEVAKLCLRMVAETDAHSVGDSYPTCRQRLPSFLLTIIYNYYFYSLEKLHSVGFKYYYKNSYCTQLKT